MDAPPKQLDTEIRRIARTHDGRTVVRSPAAVTAALPAGADSMPVLSAFNQFLDAERRSARRRMMALSFFFIIILLGISGALFFIGFGLFRQTQADLADLQQDMHAYRQTLSEVSPERIRGMLDRQQNAVESSLLSAIENTRLQTVEDSRSLIEQELTEREREVARLQEMLSEIDIENSRRRRETAALRTEWQAVMEHLRSAPLSELPGEKTAAAVIPQQRTSPRPQPHITVPLEVRGQQIPFLLPIPE